MVSSENEGRGVKSEARDQNDGRPLRRVSQTNLHSPSTRPDLAENWHWRKILAALEAGAYPETLDHAGHNEDIQTYTFALRE